MDNVMVTSPPVPFAVWPQWTAKMYAPKTGRDHLGLGSVSSDQILPALSPGINVLTYHPRYHSFYVFLLDEFWRRDLPRSRQAWIEFFRPREFIFSVGAYLCDQPEHGEMGNVVGGQKTSPLANRRLAHYDTSTDYIDSDLGGYGLYYRTVMAEMGVVYPGGGGFPYPIDVPTEKGKAIAAAFRREVQNTAYYQDYFDQDAIHVPIEVVKGYIRRACLCQLQVAASLDRSLLLDSFLHGGPEQEAEARRATLRMFVDLAAQTEGFPLDEDQFRQLLYFGSSDGGATYVPSEAVVPTFKQWRLYQAREYYAFALNGLWYHLCDWGLVAGGDLRPVPLPHFWEHMHSSLDFETLAARLNVSPPAIAADSDILGLLSWLQQIVGANGIPFDNVCTLQTPLNEDCLYQAVLDERGAPVVMIAGMITMLAMIYLRFDDADLRLRPEWRISRMGANGRLSLDGVIQSLRRRIHAGRVTVNEVARWIFRDYVILQHQLVATSKLPDNTFRFQREGDRLRFFPHDNRLSFMSARFDAIRTTVHELGLCGDLQLPSHHPTADGLTLLETGDIP